VDVEERVVCVVELLVGAEFVLSRGALRRPNHAVVHVKFLGSFRFRTGRDHDKIGGERQGDRWWMEHALKPTRFSIVAACGGTDHCDQKQD